MQKPYILIDDTGMQHKNGKCFETIAAAYAYECKHKLSATHLIYDLSNAPVVTNPQLAVELESLAQSETEAGQQTEEIVEAVMAKHGDDYDPWTEIMEDGNGYPQDNYDAADIYTWMLNNHLATGTTTWTYENICDHTEMGSSGSDGWLTVYEHLVHVGLMTPRIKT